MTTAFEKFFEKFSKTNYWHQMLSTRENSPWHREDNVAVHTSMVLDWYKNNLCDRREDAQKNMTLLACLFHDVAKPKAEVTKFSQERGEYRAYHGHELISARVWVDYAISNKQDILEFKLGIKDISNIALMIEYHVPFKIKDPSKRKNIKNSFLSRMGEDGHQSWLDMIAADQHGRISDDHGVKLREFQEWINEWEKV